MKTFLVILFLFSVFVKEIPPAWEKACSKTVKSHFSGQDIRLETGLVDDRTDDRPWPGIVVYDILEGNQIEGYVVLTSAKGRYDYFDYLVVYDTGLIIQTVKVFEYRSDHGYEICSKKWLQQFEGVNGCDLKYGEDIDCISGATFSTSSLTMDILFLCDYIRVYHNKKRG